MIIAIRISGQVNLTEKMKETLFRMRLRKKYAATLFNPTLYNIKLLNKVRNHIAYGNINRETLILLLDKRAVPKNNFKSSDAEKIAEELEKKDITSLSIKPFFRLHPPRKGIDAKKHFGTSAKGVLGDNADKINDLVRRML